MKKDDRRPRDASARARLLDLLKRHGWNATSFQSLEPGMRYWFSPDGDACFAYVDTGSAWVVAGAPIGPEEQMASLVGAFGEAAATADRRICFFATERRFLELVDLEAIVIGQQPVWDPAGWKQALAGSRSVREQLRRGRAKGVVVRVVMPEETASPDAPLRRAMQRMIDRWLAGRRMAPLGFLVQVEPFAFAAERRILVAELEGELVGFLAMVPVYARNGWLLEDLLRNEQAPNGTSELLVDEAMDLACREGSHYVTLGLAPLSGDISRWLRLARRFGRPFYRFEGIHYFKAKFRPDHWEPIHLAFPRGQSRFLTVHDALVAFAPGGLVDFAVESILRRPSLPLRLLTLLLIPWTILLALPHNERWFPSREIQYAWVLFDILLIVGLIPLSRRWRPWLATLLAAVITADALLTLIEVLAYNLPLLDGVWDSLIATVAVIGPMLTAVFLWVAASRTRAASTL